MSARDPNAIIASFLGPAAAGGGPMELLGLRAGDLAEVTILRARDARIAQLDRHPLAETPEADEVRLALHAAAAMLLHPGVRARLVARTPITPGSSTSLEQEALLTIGMMGGWNRRSLRRLAQSAHAKGRSNADVVAAVRGLARRPAPASGLTPFAQTASKPASAEHEPEREPIDDVWRIAGAVAITAVVMLVLGAITIYWMIPDRKARASTPASVESMPSVVAPARSEPYIPESRERLASASAVAHELAGATSLAPTDQAGALKRYESATRQLAEQWPGFRPDELPGVLEGARVCLAAFDADTRGRAIEHLRSLATDTDPAAAVWGAGMLAGAASTSEGAFARGVIERLDALAQSLPPEVDSVWERWVLAAQRVPGPTEDERRAIVLRALDRLSRTASSPSPHTLGSVAVGVDWRPGGRARDWLIGAFDAADVGSDRLSWITSALAGMSAASGVDATMILPESGGPDERRELRDRYARVWGVKVRTLDDDLGVQIVQRITDAAGGAGEARSMVERVRAIADLAVANAAAELYEQQANERAAQVLDDGRLRLEGVQRTAGAPDPSASTPGGAWGADYLGLGSDASARIAKLRSLGDSFEGFGQADFAVVLEEAFSSQPREVREAAASVAGQFGAHPDALLAAMDMIDSVPRVEASARLVEQLTGRRVWTGDWERFAEQARRALVERLLELIASGTDETRVDALAGVIDWAYGAALGGDLAAEPAAAYRSARTLQDRWRLFALDPYTLLSEDLNPAETVGRRDRRAALARGAIERLAVEQRALVELMAARTATEHPSAGARVRTLMESLQASDRAARDAVGQILEGERVRAALWQIRLGGEQS